MISDPLAFLLWFFLLQSPFLAPPVSSPARPPERPDTLAPTSSPTSHPTSSNKPVLSPLPTSLPVLPKNPTPQGWRNFRLYEPSRWWNFRFHAEIGTTKILSHLLQAGKSGTLFNYVEAGGHDILFASARLSVDLEIVKQHTLVFLYQPLDLRTEGGLGSDLRVEDLTFPKGTAMHFRYNYDMYRISYLFDFFPQPDTELAIGLSMQIRSSTIRFASGDGALERMRQGLGLVPFLVKLRGRLPLGSGFWLGLEVDGIWLSGAVLAGSADPFEGALVDASIRAGFQLLAGVDLFFNLRYIGGGARGQDSEASKKRPGTDGFTDTWLHLLTFSVGATLR